MGPVEPVNPSLISHGCGSLFMQKPLSLIALSIFAVVVNLHAARADQCDDTIAAWNKRVSRHSDEGLDRLAASPTKKRTRAEEIAELCGLHKWDLAGRTRQLSELKQIEVTCGTTKKASYGVKDIERLQAQAQKSVADTCK